MNAFRCFQKYPNTPRNSRHEETLICSIGLWALLLALSSYGAEHGGGGFRGGGAPRGPGPAISPSRPALSPTGPALRPTGPAIVERPNYGTIRHFDTHVVQRPVQVRPEPQRRIEPGREFGNRNDVFVHRDVDVDVHRNHAWNDFRFHRHFRELPFGFLTLSIGGFPYYYSDGIYYQSAADGYDEVYPPVGAIIPQPPDGAVPIYAGGTTYYYAGGAFYLQQSDGSYAIASTPIGVVVPELPPGAVQVTINGNTAYQFNNIYYEPVFVNGVTQYQTFAP
jgi:hypothetical protein